MTSINRSEVVYGGPHKSEYIAIEYLKQRYIKIQRNKDKTPDFICVGKDGRVDRIEVKRLQSGIIFFTHNQANKMRDDDIVLVVDDEKVVGSFYWKDRDKVKWRVTVGEKKEDVATLQIKLDWDTYHRLVVLKGKMKAKTWKDFIKKILEKGEIFESDVVAF